MNYQSFADAARVDHAAIMHDAHIWSKSPMSDASFRRSERRSAVRFSVTARRKKFAVTLRYLRSIGRVTAR